MRKSLQIILMGWEWDRLVYGLKQHPPQKAILICSSESSGAGRKWTGTTKNITKDLIDKISELIETEVYTLNYYDFDECIFTLVRIIEKNINKYDEISINISSGNKVLVTAAVMVSQYYPVNLFYVVPEKYNVPDNQPYLTSGAKDVIELPTFDMRELVIPTKKQYEILNEVSEEGVLFTDLVKSYAARRGMKIDDYKMRKMKSLFFYHLKKLKHKKLISMEIVGGQLMKIGRASCRERV